VSDAAGGGGTGRRTALVTGASSGIGAAIAIALGALGWSVAIGARRSDRLGEVASRIVDAGGGGFAHVLDVSEPSSIEAFFAAAERELGPIDVVVSNAGVGVPGRLQDLDVEDLRHEITTNLLGPMLVARRAIPSMIERGRGDVVFITSLNAVSPRPLQIGYTASKSGLEGAARTLRMELEGTGVRSTIIRPGPTRTDFGTGWADETVSEILDSWKHWGVLRHMQTLPAESVAAAVVAVVTAPPGTHLDEIQINPEGPVQRNE